MLLTSLYEVNLTFSTLLNFYDPFSFRLKPEAFINSLRAFMKVQKGLQRTLSCPGEAVTIARQDSIVEQNTTLSDLSKMPDGTDGKRGPPPCSDDEIPTAEDDKGSCSGSTHTQQRPDCKRLVLIDNEHKPADFMNLPGEIRNIIYHKVLTTPGGGFFIRREYSNELCRSRPVLGNSQSLFPTVSDYYNHQHTASTRNLALLRTSKAVYAEAVAILYGQKLVFANQKALQSFLVGLRPSQISLLRHVALAPDDLGLRNEFMPSVVAPLADTDNLETLDPDMKQVGHGRLRRNIALLLDDTLSFAAWDAAVARTMAGDVYCHLFTYLRRAVAVRGIDKVMEVLDVFQDDFRTGLGTISNEFKPRHVQKVEWTEERKTAMKKVMGEEIERLIKENNY